MKKANRGLIFAEAEIVKSKQINKQNIEHQKVHMESLMLKRITANCFSGLISTVSYGPNFLLIQTPRINKITIVTPIYHSSPPLCQLDHKHLMRCQTNMRLSITSYSKCITHIVSHKITHCCQLNLSLLRRKESDTRSHKPNSLNHIFTTSMSSNQTL